MPISKEEEILLKLEKEAEEAEKILQELTSRLEYLEELKKKKSTLDNKNKNKEKLKKTDGKKDKHAGKNDIKFDENFYITTAINYTNGLPHMGHAYEAIVSDVIARYHRIFGRNVFFMTGTDEHGQKIANAAEKLGIKPIEICNKYAANFQELDRLLNVSYDYFIRTTMDKHIKTAQNIWERCLKNGDIYLGTYSGWYNVKEEAFVTENEASLMDYKDPSTGTPLVKMEESSYFFKMSKYYTQIKDWIQNHPEFIQPESRRKEILQRLQEPLLDLSISRTTFDWGIPVPNDPKHVIQNASFWQIQWEILSNVQLN